MVSDVMGDLVRDYSEEPRPLSAYAVLVGIFNGLFVGFVVLMKRSGRSLPTNVDFQDLLLLSVATHKLSRLLTKDWVTSTFRAPFTTYRGPSKIMAEVNEDPRGHGWRYAIGQLVTCQFCMGQWVAAGFSYGLLMRPKLTRLVAGIFTIVALSDFLHIAYERAMLRLKQLDQDTRANE